MPTYKLKDTNTGEIFEKMMKMAEYDQYKKDNPHIERFFDESPPIGDPVHLGVKRIDNGFREVLQKISERAPGGKALRDNIR